MEEAFFGPSDAPLRPQNMRARRRYLEREPDRSPFIIGLPFLFLLFLWAFLVFDPVGHLPTPPGKPFRERTGISGRVAAEADVAHDLVRLRPVIRQGLLWLARHQFEDGSWSSYYFRQMCMARCYCPGPGGREHDVGVTAMVTLAFLESGFSRERTGEYDFEQVVRRALRWLAERQDPQGCFGRREGKFLYGHALATAAFARAYREYGDPTFPRNIRGGVRFLEEARNPGLVWRYGVRDGQNDTSMTGWAGAALLEARAAGIEVPSAMFEGIRAWLDRVTDERYYSVSYMRPRGGSSSIRGVNEHYQQTESLTAVGMALRLGMGEEADAFCVREGGLRLKRDLPTWDEPEGTCVDYLYWYHGLKALSLCAERQEEVFGLWSERLRRILTERQRKYNSQDDMCSWGSWDPAGKWGREGGRVYATAINVMTLSLLDGARPGPAPADPGFVEFDPEPR